MVEALLHTAIIELTFEHVKRPSARNSPRPTLHQVSRPESEAERQRGSRISREPISMQNCYGREVSSARPEASSTHGQ
jgi:hypothetical protein